VRTRVVPPKGTHFTFPHPPGFTCRAITFRPYGAGIRWFDSTWFPKKSVLTHTLKPSLILCDLRGAKAPLYHSAAGFRKFFRSLLSMAIQEYTSPL